MWSKLKAFEAPQSAISLKSKLRCDANILNMSFELSGALDEISLAKPVKSPARIQGLWQTTCFEVFIKNQESEEYIEFNFSSEYDWNCFYFPNKKSRLKEYQKITNLSVNSVKENTTFFIESSVDLNKLPDGLWKKNKMRIGPAAILESKTKELTYWACKHLDKVPNFHNHDSFNYEL